MTVVNKFHLIGLSALIVLMLPLQASADNCADYKDAVCSLCGADTDACKVAGDTLEMYKDLDDCVSAKDGMAEMESYIKELPEDQQTLAVTSICEAMGQTFDEGDLGDVEVDEKACEKFTTTVCDLCGKDSDICKGATELEEPYECTVILDIMTEMIEAGEDKEILCGGMF